MTLKPKFVFDTSPTIILLEKCELSLQLLSFAKHHILVSPKRVMEEFSVGDRENPKPDAAVFKKVFAVRNAPLDKELLPFFNYDPSSGEIWVISYARQHPDFTCVIDEAFGRSVCNLFGIRVTGTIGIVKEMKKGKLLNSDDLKVIRDRIKESRFYLSRELLRQLDVICGS